MKKSMGIDKKNPLIVIISGPPCTGKTTLGKKIANELGLPFFHKDGIKEILFDTLGWSNREVSRKQSLAANAVLHYIMESNLAAGNSCIIESNFKLENQDKILSLKEKYNFTPIQIMCETKGEILCHRFEERAECGIRHPGHIDNQNYDEFKEMLMKGRYEPLVIGGEIITVDTTDFSRVDYEGIIKQVKKYVK